MRQKLFSTLILALLASATLSHAQLLIDPGFENYDVSAGGFVKPTSGPWFFSNDAGVVEPYSPNSSTGPLNTWSATFAPVDGAQYASTYAGGDTIRQTVSFDAPGAYRLSVYAAAPDGTVNIPPTLTLQDGQFTFTFANISIGTPHTVSAGGDWSLYTADFIVAVPSDYPVGVRNTLSAPYFINYDAFAIQPVPEPSTIALGVLGALALVLRRRRSTS